MKTKQLPKGWKEVELGDVLDYEQPTKYIVKSEKYNDKYKTPVLTAGKTFLLGYTDEKEGTYNNLPVIIFDDFTTTSKFVDFPFKVKSSAMKMLTPKTKLVNLKLVYAIMQRIKINTKTHKRYYLSTYQKIRIPLPFKDGELDKNEQDRIVKNIEKIENIKEKQEESLKETEKLYHSYIDKIIKGEK